MKLPKMTPVQFATQLQEYFGKTYNDAQASRLRTWCAKRGPEMLALIFMRVTESARFLPLLADLNKAQIEVYEGYPELRLDSWNRTTDAKQITDSAGFTEEEREKNLAKLRETVGLAARQRRFRAVKPGTGFNETLATEVMN